MNRIKKKSDDPNSMRQGGLGIAARNPSHSTSSLPTSSSTLSSSSTSNLQPVSSSSSTHQKNEYDPTDEDRIEILKSSKSKGGRFRLTKPQKTNILSDVWDNRANILVAIKSADKEDRCGLQRRFHQILHFIDKKDKRSRAPVENLASWLVALHDIFFNVNKIRRVPLRNPPDAMNSILKMMKKVDSQVRRDIYNDKKYEKNYRIELTPAQEMKCWDKKLVPDDDALCCPYCNHKGTLNCLEGYEQISDKNRQKVKDYRNKKDQWEKHIKNKKIRFH